LSAVTSEEASQYYQELVGGASLHLGLDQ
jgi:hypothetical protein